MMRAAFTLIVAAAGETSFELSIPGSEANGRAFVFISKTACSVDEPRNLVGDDQDTEQLFGKDVVNRKVGEAVVVDANALGYPVTNMTRIKDDTYCIQGLFQPYERFDRSDGHSILLPRTIVNSYEGGALFAAPGTRYSKPKMMKLEKGRVVLSIDEVVPASAFPAISAANDTKYIKHIRLRSSKLSHFWGKDIFLEATVLLPYGFDEHPEARYPLFVYQGHYHADFATPVPFSEHPADPSLTGYEKVQAEYAYYLFRNWTSTKAEENSPFYKRRGIILEIKHANPYYDDSYSVNSANLGPYGDAIHFELLPVVEKRFRAIGEGWARATYGGSTGGWESVAVQVFYPDLYNGCWTFCPDPVSFQSYTTVNIYKDVNAYFMSDKWKRTPRPAIRDHASNEIYPGYGAPLGEVIATQEEVGIKELVMGTHSRSTGQWDIWEAVFSPTDDVTGYPARIWNKRTGEINHTVAKYWQDHFDLQYILQRDWHKPHVRADVNDAANKTLGEKLQSDTYYLNDAVYFMENFLKTTTSPHYDGVVKFGSHDGRGYEHCWSGDDTVPNSIGRLTINERIIPQMVERMLRTAPKDADTATWRY